jgi:hypothetical protein
LVVMAIRDTFCRMDGKARVNGTVVAEASMMCKMVDLAELEQPPAPLSPKEAPTSAR